MKKINTHAYISLFFVLIIYYPKYLKKISKVVFEINKIRRINFLQIVINNTEIDLSDVTSAFSFLEGRYSVIRHDNTGMEFGAYQKGINEIRKYLVNKYEIIVCNDTVGSHSDQQLVTKGFLTSFLCSLNNTDFPSRVVGSICSTPRRFFISGKLTSRWIRSNILAFDADALAAVDFRLYSPEIEKFVTEQLDESKFFTDDVGNTLQVHIKKWLFSKTGNFWYDARPLNSDNRDFFAKKARSILQEKYLSMRLEEASVAFLEPKFNRVQKCLYWILCIFNRLTWGRVRAFFRRTLSPKD